MTLCSHILGLIKDSTCLRCYQCFGSKCDQIVTLYDTAIIDCPDDSKFCLVKSENRLLNLGI